MTDLVDRKKVIEALSSFADDLNSLEDFTDDQKLAMRWAIVNAIGIINHDIESEDAP